jgi:enoyl-CoA hydratase/carnithine racemase
LIDLERDGAVFVLRMRAGENRVNRAFLEQMNRALDEVGSSRGDAALVTTGEGKFYSNGLDLAGFADAGADEARHVLGGLNDLLARLLAFPVATIAALNGHAFAAGAMLALAHDFRVMRSDRGYFCLPEIDLATGQPLTAGMYALIEARLSRSAFHEALVTGRRYAAREAVERQMVKARGQGPRDDVGAETGLVPLRTRGAGSSPSRVVRVGVRAPLGSSGGRSILPSSTS